MNQPRPNRVSMGNNLMIDSVEKLSLVTEASDKGLGARGNFGGAY